MLTMAFRVNQTPQSRIIPQSTTKRRQQQQQHRLPKNPSCSLPYSSSSSYSAVHSVAGVNPFRLQAINPRFSTALRPITSSTLTLKENFGVVQANNWTLSDEDKLRCWWTLGGAMADIKDVRQTDTGSKQKKRDGKKKSWKKLHPKVYTVIVGASFCVTLALCSVTLPSMVHSSRYVVVPYSDLMSGIREGSVDRVQFAENSRHIFFNKKSLGDPNAETSDGNSIAKKEGNIQEVSNAGILKFKAILENLLKRERGSKLVSERNEACKPRWQYATRNVDDDKYDLLVLLKEMGVTYGADPELLSVSTKNILFALFQQAPYWIMVLLTCFQLSSQLSLGKSNPKKPSEKQSVTFSDVEGVDAAKEELLEIVLCMKGDSKYSKLGAKVPKGVLLAGPPGTGKTLLARAVAGEAGMSFFSMSASEFNEVFVGRGAARVRNLFHEARKHSPSIIFIDEIDAVGRHRGGTSNMEHDQTLNQLLTEMDGFEKDSNVVVIAATNRPEMLDSALMRPGRFSRKVHVEAPDLEGRKKIFGIYLKNIVTEEDKEALCDLVAGLTPDLVGADLENIASEAVLLAARRGDDSVKREDFVLACERANAKLPNYSSEPPYPPPPMGGGATFGYGML